VYIPMMRMNIPMSSAVRPLPSDMCISLLVFCGLQDASQVVIVTSVERGLRAPLSASLLFSVFGFSARPQAYPLSRSRKVDNIGQETDTLRPQAEEV
jgi:hypothetical protein